MKESDSGGGDGSSGGSGSVGASKRNVRLKLYWEPGKNYFFIKRKSECILQD